MSQNIFQTSVNEAIQASLAQDKILLIYLSDESATSVQFGDTLIIHNAHLRGLVETHFVLLKLVKDSQEYSFYEQVFTVQKVPSVHALKGGVTLDVIYAETVLSLDEFNLRIDGVVEKAGAGTEQVTQQAAQQAQQVTQQATPSTSTPSNSHSIPHSNPHTPSNPPPTSPAPPHKNLKEEAAEVAARKYREQVLKQHQQEKEERERILRLLKLDKEERRKRRQAEPVSKEKATEGPAEPNEDSTSQPPALKENLDPSKHNEDPEYKIQLKLFNGQSLRQSFPPSTTLSEIREFINDKYPEYQMAAYYFYKPIERITYSDMDELNKNLKELNLNRSLLIIKPSDHYGASGDMKKQLFQNLANQQSSFQWLKSTVGGVFGSIFGAGRPIHELGNDNSGVGNDILSPGHAPTVLSNPSATLLAPNGSSAAPLMAPVIANDINVLDSITSDHSQYSTPVIRSLESSRLSTPRPALMLSDSTNNFSILASNDHGSSAAGAPSASSMTTSASDDSKRDKRLVYNGNELSLEDDKKKGKF